MYDSVTSRLSANVYRVQFFAGARILTVAQVLNLWRTQTSFIACFCHALAKAPFDAFFFEMPPVSVATRDRAFECVIAHAPALCGVLPDCGAFAPYFENQHRESVVVFVNLARDALLIAPSSCEPKAAYGQLAAFLRGAKVTHVHALWRAVGGTMLELKETQLGNERMHTLRTHVENLKNLSSPIRANKVTTSLLNPPCTSI